MNEETTPSEVLNPEPCAPFNHETGSLRLEKIVIEGFKSFASRVQVQFQPGITAIVGPNGCGKSNIVDAIRWVLGEPSAKSLRAEAMQDVLFAGAQGQHSASLAQVTLELSGRHPARPLLIDRFEIERRLFRTGESEYKLNKRVCRLKDIHELFADTGLGRNAFAIFEQGRIEQMVIMSGAQRRLLIEEAAGIAGFKIQKKEALAKWQVIDTQLQQITQVYQELDARVCQLKEQSQKAIEWKECQSEIERLVRLGQIHKWNQLDAQSRELCERLKQMELQLASLREDKQKAQERLYTLEQILEKEEADLFHKTQESQQAREKEIEATQALKFLETQKIEDARLKQHLKDYLEKSKLKQSSLSAQLRHSQEQLSRLQKQQEECERVLEADEASLEKIKSLQNELYKQKQDIEAQQLEIRHQKQLLEQNRQSLRNQKEQISRQLTSSTQALQKVEGDFSVAQKESEALDQNIQALSSIEESSQVIETLKQTFFKEQQLYDEEKTNLSEIQAHIHQKQAHLKWLEERVRSSGEKEFTRWLAAFLTPEQLQQVTALSPLLAKEISSQDLAFWKHLQTVHLVDLRLMPKLEELLQDEKAPSFALWPIFQGEGESFERACARHVKSSLEAFLEIRREKNWKNWAKRLVQVDDIGILWSIERSASSAQMLKEIPEEKSLLQLHIEREKALIESISGRRVKLEESKSRLQKLEKEATFQTLEHQKQRSKLEALQGRLHYLKEQEVSHRQNMESLKKSLEPIEHALLEVETRLSEMPQMQEEGFSSTLKAIQESQRQWHNIKTQKESKEREKNNLLQETARFQAQHQGASSSLKELEESLDVDEQAYETQALKEKQTLERFEKAKQQQVHFTLHSQSLLQELEKQQGAHQSLKAEIKDLFRQIKIFETKIEQVQNKYVLEGKKLDEIQWSKRLLEDSIDIQEAQLWDGIAVDPSDLEAQIIIHKARQQELGFVNFAAAKELDEMQERHSLIQTQIEDVQAAKIELMRIIAHLDEKCHVQFEQTYQRVKEAFKRNFTQIFEGGQADLLLTGEQDSQGIEIQAFPPGKQVKSLVLMSGGEKCLTALAFMMALFEVRPAPFCLLDEIDAPLDDANVEKLIRLLKHYSERTQVFIITHNKKTMAAASTLLGVSMPKRGVSQLLVLDIGTRQVQATSASQMLEKVSS